MNQHDTYQSTADPDESTTNSTTTRHETYARSLSGRGNVADNGTEAVEMTLSAVGVVPEETYTVGHAINALGFGAFQIRLSLVTGLSWMADSMEMMILSMLSPALHCEWGINNYQQALVTTFVFLGMMLSSTFWGSFSDRYGRRKALITSALLLSYYGILSASAPTYFWIVFLRGLVGFANGCVPQAVTLYAEFLPTKHRGKCVVLLETFWALGACCEVLLAVVVMPTLGWRWLLGLSAIPSLLFLCSSYWLPESIRFLSATGRTDEAVDLLQEVAKQNRKPLLLGRLVTDEAPPERGRIWDLLVPELRTTSLLLWFIWIASAFCYYGLVLMSTELLGNTRELCSDTEASTPETCLAACRPLTSLNYMDLLWITSAEFPGIFVTVLVVEKLGRKRTMAVEFVVFTIAAFSLFACVQDQVALTVILFVGRSIVTGVFQAAYIYTPEVYPTSLRSVGVGTCNGMARLGAMVTPYVAQVVLKSSVHVAAGIYGGAALLAACAVFFLPVETKGRDMTERMER